MQASLVTYRSIDEAADMGCSDYGLRKVGVMESVTADYRKDEISGSGS